MLINLYFILFFIRIIWYSENYYIMDNLNSNQAGPFKKIKFF